MKHLARLSWGIVIYAIMYLAWNAFAIHGFTQGVPPRIAELAILVVICAIAGRALKFHSWKDILPYSFFWAITAIALDAIFTLPFAGTAMYSNWNIWVGYALVMLLPLAAPLTRIFRDDAPEIS